MTKMAAMPIHGKIPLKIIFPGTSGIISTKFGILDPGLWPRMAHHNLLKLLPWVDSDGFFGKLLQPLTCKLVDILN